jgi:hypothetical protein
MKFQIQQQSILTGYGTNKTMTADDIKTTYGHHITIQDITDLQKGAKVHLLSSRTTITYIKRIYENN